MENISSAELLEEQALDTNLNHSMTDVPNLHGRRVLVVDDIETNRIVLREFIAGTGAVVQEAEDGIEALELFKESEIGYFDFIFMDLLMPNMNGHDATRAIRNLDRTDAIKVPIVAVTTCAFKDDIEESLAAGMDAHLSKPVDLEIILKTLREKLQ